MKQGWIKLHRSLLDWEWFTDPPTAHLFNYCLMRANHAPAKWRGVVIERGQFWTSLPTIAVETGLSVQNVRTSLAKLSLTGELTDESRSTGRMVTIKNYHEYQLPTDESTDESTGDQQTSNRRVTANKKNKKEKNEKNTPLVEEVWSITPKMGKSRSSKAKLKTALSKTKATKEEIMEGLRAWVDSADWKKDGGQFVQGIHIWAKDCKWENPPPKLTYNQPII